MRIPKSPRLIPSFAQYMVLRVFLDVLAASILVSALPFDKRVSQTVTDSTTAWVSACAAAGGSTNCTTISHQAFPALFPSKNNCEQQDVADSMIDLAKQHNSDPEMIRLALLYAQQPRNSPDNEQMPYCQTPPRNQELVGYYQCQFAGVNFNKFFGDQTGNIPLGLTSVDPPGSCPANPEGPIPDSVQLYTIVTDPGQPQDSANNSLPSLDVSAQGQAIIDIETTTITLTAPTSLAKSRRNENDENMLSTFKHLDPGPSRSNVANPNDSSAPIAPLKLDSSGSHSGLGSSKNDLSLFSITGVHSHMRELDPEIQARSHEPHAPPHGSSPKRPHNHDHNKAPTKPGSPQAPPGVKPETKPPARMSRRDSRHEAFAFLRDRTNNDFHIHHERDASQGEDSSGPSGSQSNSFGQETQNQGISRSGSDSSSSGSNQTGDTISQNVGPAPKTHRKSKCKHCKKD